MLKKIAQAKVGCHFVRMWHSPGGLLSRLFDEHIRAPLWIALPESSPNLIKNFISLKQDMKVGIPENTPDLERAFLNDIWTYVCGPYYDLPCAKYYDPIIGSEPKPFISCEEFDNGNKQ